MEATEVKKLIEKCESENTLPKEQKRARLMILKAATFKVNHEVGYQEYIKQYKLLAEQLEQESKGKFIYNENINTVITDLEEYIDSLELVKYLKDNKIPTSNFERLLEYSSKLDLNVTIIPLVMGIYRIIDKIETIEKYQVQTIETCLANVFGINLVSPYNYTFVVENSKARVRKDKKSLEQLEHDHTTALSKAESYHLYLGSPICEWSSELINEVFRYYKKGNRKIERTR